MSPEPSKQRAFVAEYLKDFNAAAATRRAGYSPKTVAVIGHENLRTNIPQAIKEALEAHAMSAEEALYRLSAIARGDMDNFISADGWLDLEKARELGLTPLIHELTADRRTGGEGALPRAAKRPVRRPVAAPAPAGPANPSEEDSLGPTRPGGRTADRRAPI